MCDIDTICQCNFHGLLCKKNVVGVSRGTKIQNGIDTGMECITVFVKNKVNSNSISPSDIIPNYYFGHATDVVETGVIRASSLTSKVRPMIFGYSIGPSNLYLAGTSGALSKDRVNYYILSNNHVLASENTLPLNSKIMQPALLDGGVYPNDVIAELYKFIPIQFTTATSSPANSVDAAIAKILNPPDVTPSIFSIGSISGINSRPTLNLSVKKSGRTTEFTTGVIKYLKSTVQVSYSGGKTAIFTNQIITSPMSSPGDSGSLLLDSNNKAVGLLFAGSDSMTIHNPISTVLNALSISLV